MYNNAHVKSLRDCRHCCHKYLNNILVNGPQVICGEIHAIYEDSIAREIINVTLQNMGHYYNVS